MDNSEFPHEHRPDLNPVDPRATASSNPAFAIHGSIDNENEFQLDGNKSFPSRH